MIVIHLTPKPFCSLLNLKKTVHRNSIQNNFDTEIHWVLTNPLLETSLSCSLWLTFECCKYLGWTSILLDVHEIHTSFKWFKSIQEEEMPGNKSYSSNILKPKHCRTAKLNLKTAFQDHQNLNPHIIVISRWWTVVKISSDPRLL